MAFKGARGQSARDIAEAAEARGADLNAATDYERTSYTARCLSSDSAALLDQALALVFAPDHPEDEIGREKSVVLQEIGEAADQPDDLVFDLAQAAAFPGHPLGRPILGVPETLAAVRREDLLDFAGAHYTPDRTVVTAAGAFNREEVIAVAERWLAGRPAVARNAAMVEPPLGASEVKGAVRRTEQTHLVVSRPAPAATSRDRFAARLLAEIIGGGMASRLFQEVREQRGLAYTIDASCDQYLTAGCFSVYAGCAARDAAEVVRLTLGVWEDLAAKGPTPSELSRAKAVLKASLAMSAEAPSARAARAAYDLLTFGTLSDLDVIADAVEAVNAGDLRRVASTALEGRPSVAVVGSKASIRAIEAVV
jgi:predicted Zn-dependent peptidase